jgi:hypothetical protein
LASAILGTLPLGMGIALNPLAIVAGILILRTAHPRRNGIVFAAGWILGLILLVALSTQLVLLQLRGARGALSALPAIIWVAIGAILLFAAARAGRGRPLPGEEPEPPRWLRVIDRSGTGRVFGIGFFLATVSIRNVALLAAAAGVFSQASLGPIELAVSVAVFIAISSIGILVPLLVRLVGGEGADATLAAWSAWLNRHVSTITGGVLGVLGVYLLLRGVLGVLS